MQPDNAPPPNLRIIPSSAAEPHEEHDDQRSIPLMEAIRSAEFMKNPPIVTHTADDHYIILDGANRCHTFQALEIPHILVQVVSYFSGQVTLETWNHVVSQWDETEFLKQVNKLTDITMTEGQDKNAIAHILLRNGDVFALDAPVQSVHERNAALRDFVRVYQQNAVLDRTQLFEPMEVFRLYPKGNALVVFPGYEPRDIVEATRYKAYLPPGISRHIVQGRALQINYPLDKLRDHAVSLEEKNAELKAWLSKKLDNRQFRYYAEATYQFNE